MCCPDYYILNLLGQGIAILFHWVWAAAQSYYSTLKSHLCLVVQRFVFVKAYSSLNGCYSTNATHLGGTNMAWFHVYPKVNVPLKQPMPVKTSLNSLYLACVSKAPFSTSFLFSGPAIKNPFLFNLLPLTIGLRFEFLFV